MEFNCTSLFNVENSALFELFKEYSIQDAVCLKEALDVARSEYLDSYKVDIATIHSTATLSLKIFRMNFLLEDKAIPILKGMYDRFVRGEFSLRDPEGGEAFQVPTSP